MRVRAAAVVVDGDDLLVVERSKDGREYAVLPGGGVEDGERLDEACRRELLEETGLVGEVGPRLDVPVQPDAPVAYFVVRVHSRGLLLGGPERERQTDRNRYRPSWVHLDALDEIGLVPRSARKAVEIARSTTH